MKSHEQAPLYLIYDGECLLCRNTALALKLKKSAGQLVLINARESHPIVKKVLALGYDLNEGIVVQHRDMIYYGVDAMHFIALLTTPSRAFNKLNAFCFKYRIVAVTLYPVLKLIRKLLLLLHRVPKLKSPSAVNFKTIFGSRWETMPTLLRKRYGDESLVKYPVTLKGYLNIKFSKFFLLLSPFTRLLGVLVPYQGEKIPVEVMFEKNKSSKVYVMRRTFFYPERVPYCFNSAMKLLPNNFVMELMRFGVGVRMKYVVEHNKIIMRHGGYVLHVMGKNIVLPASLLFGKSYAEEEAVSESQFKILVSLTHPLFGLLFQYDGVFSVEEV